MGRLLLLFILSNILLPCISNTQGKKAINSSKGQNLSFIQKAENFVEKQPQIHPQFLLSCELCKRMAGSMNQVRKNFMNF